MYENASAGDIIWKQKILAQENERTKDLSLTIGSTSMPVAKTKMIDGPIIPGFGK
jgi:hypothetical protein